MIAWNKSVGEIVAELKMMQTSFGGFFWIVEGPSDIRFFAARKSVDVELVVAGGKTNVINTIKRLQQDPINDKILGIVDSDIDWLVLQEERPGNVISTDPRDIEGILLRSTALGKVLAEYADAGKVSAFESKVGKTVRDYIHDASELFGRIRAVNDLHNKVSLRKFRPQIFISKKDWSYDYEAALSFCVGLGVCTSVVELKRLVGLLPDKELWSYVRGHDAVNILVGGLLKEIGRGFPVDESIVGSVLRAGIEDREYHQSKLYQSIESWRNNSAVIG